MAIVVNCECGKQLRAREELAGRKGKCPGCGRHFVIPAPPPPEPAEEELFDLAPEDPAVDQRIARPAPPPPPRPEALQKPPPLRRAVATTAKTDYDGESSLPLSPSSRLRELVYLVLLVTLIPLLLSTLRGHDAHDFEKRIEKTIEAHPEVQSKLTEESSLEDLLDALPAHKLDDALLPHGSSAPWLFALLSAGAFFGATLLLFRFGTVHPGRLLAIGAFTATAGILLLLAVQWIADWTSGYYMRGRGGIVMLIFYIFKFIGFSYNCALDPETNFMISFLGFTFGVGMCEELCKSIPILVHYRNKADMPWRGACLWGLISGVGFGVSEGITYSSDFYNGLSGGDIYVVRFVSCVALHAIWSGAAAIFIYKHNNLLNEGEGPFSFLLGAAALVSIPMVLHGLYDTLLKKDYDGWALATGIVSFAWFAFQVETARKTYDEQEAPRTPQRAFAVAR